MSTELFAEVALGDVKNRNRIVPVRSAAPSKDRRECYRSMFLFDWQLREHVKHTNSVTGYTGPHTADAFVIDVDREDDLEGAKRDAMNIVQRLIAYYDVPSGAIRPSFSGAKGFHLALPIQAVTGERALHRNFSAAFKGLASDITDGIASVDLVIYEENRILRMLNTINGKTGLYKIPLSIHELETLTIEEIRELAREPRSVEYTPADEFSPVPSLAEVFGKYLHERIRSEAPRKTDGAFVDLLAGPDKGRRNDALTRLTGLYISKGHDLEFTLEFMRVWNRACTPPLEDDELENTVRGEYARYHGGAVPEIFNLRQMGERYAEHVQRMKGAVVKTGFPALDEKLRGIIPGEACCILGKTSVGKSAFAQFVAKQYAEDSGNPVLFFSLEMPLESVFERHYQMVMDATGYDTEHAFDADAKTVRERIEKAYNSAPNFWTCETATMDINAIKAHIRYAESNIYGEKTGLVLVDYLGLIVGKGKDVYEQISGIARGMKNVAKELHVPIVYLVQVNRKFSIYDELEFGAARDSGSIDEAADQIIGIWSAPKEQQTDKSVVNLVCGIVKNRKGGKGSFATRMNKRSLRFEMDSPPPNEEPF